MADDKDKKEVKPPLPGWRKIKLLTDGYGGLNYPQGSVIEVREGDATYAVQSGKAIYAPDDAEVTEVGDLKPDADSERERADKTAKAIDAADKAAATAGQKPDKDHPAHPHGGPPGQNKPEASPRR